MHSENLKQEIEKIPTQTAIINNCKLSISTHWNDKEFEVSILQFLKTNLSTLHNIDKKKLAGELQIFLEDAYKKKAHVIFGVDYCTSINYDGEYYSEIILESNEKNQHEVLKMKLISYLFEESSESIKDTLKQLKKLVSKVAIDQVNQQRSNKSIPVQNSYNSKNQEASLITIIGGIEKELREKFKQQFKFHIIIGQDQVDMINHYQNPECAQRDQIRVKDSILDISIFQI